MKPYLYLLSRWRDYYEYIPIEEVLHYGKTRYQEVLIGRNSTYGTFLVLDGKIQSTEVDEYKYHEAMVYPALVSHPSPKTILVVGNGEGTIIKYLLEYPFIEEIDWVDIDEELVKICEKHLPYSFKQRDITKEQVKLNFFAEDGLKFLERTKKKYDIIYFDLTDPSEENPLANNLYSTLTAKKVKEKLKDGGIFVSLAYEKKNGKWQKGSEYLRNIYKIVRYYGVYIPSFGTYTLFVFASDRVDPLKVDPSAIKKKIKNKNLKFYNEYTHFLMFSLIF